MLKAERHYAASKASAYGPFCKISGKPDKGLVRLLHRLDRLLTAILLVLLKLLQASLCLFSRLLALGFLFSKLLRCFNLIVDVGDDGCTQSGEICRLSIDVLPHLRLTLKVFLILPKSFHETLESGIIDRDFEDRCSHRSLTL